jgi:dephospho-CoA kinase
MLKIGITGGIGSGKTTVCKLFELLGVPVYYADERAKVITTENQKLKKEIIAVFGPNSYLGDGSYNRPYISGIVFKDSSKLALLNSIIHPAVRLDGNEWQEKHSKYPYTLKEAALLFESGSNQDLDKIIFVAAPESMRIQRVIARDHLSETEIRQRIQKQMPDDEKRSKSDFVILNDGSTSLIRQVKILHRSLSAYSRWMNIG